MSSSSSAAAAPPPKICFNPLCKESKSEPARKKGWRLRSGELADLCDRCHSTYEQGIFCETFHLDAAGWRKCESCGKRLHCGCIISAPTYMLLDIGGVDCAACARKTLAMAPKQMLSSPLLMTQQASERMKNANVKGRSQMIGSFPGPLRQAANMWNVAGAQSDLHQRLAFEFDRPRKMEDMSVKASTSLNNVTRDRYTNGNVVGLDSFSAYNTYTGEEVRTDILQDSVHLIRENDSVLTRRTLISDPSSTSSRIDLTNPNSHVNSLHSSLVKEDSTCSGTGVIAPFSSPNDTNDSTWTSTQRLTAPPMSQQMHSSPQSIMDSCSELQAQMRNGKPRVDARARAQLLPRYWPRLTDQELQQISGDSNSVITPLFEKMLSASDAGRIGRLVLPKKCAEAYFPPIFQPEGLPLKVQDATGKEWVFQFRFWPNNNSRMYVLEGVTPCIQTMQLQAGDTVTFSRIDPEGKLVMGFRKASIIPTEQDIPMPKAGNGLTTPMEADTKNTSAESIPNLPVRPLKESTGSRSSNKTADQGSLFTCDKSGYIGKNGPTSKTSVGYGKRKGNTSGSKNKRLLMNHQESIQLKLTWEAAQDLLRPPPNGASSTVIIEGHEFEEYEEAPVIGMPTIFTTNQTGDKCQWAQCEDCSKWRRLPADALLPSRWTCSDNTWDPERSSCLSAQEPSVEQLFPPIKMGSSKRSKVKVENDSVEVEGSDGLDTLANLAILGEGDELGTSSQATTTKHPRHRPGCSCIVCIQPPSGKGPKHKPTCLCTVCSTVKRRFRTLMLRREQRLSEKEAETARQLLLIQSPDMDSSSQKTSVIDDGVMFEEAEQRKAEQSPVKAHIDLNMHPDREEDPSQGAAAARA